MDDAVYPLCTSGPAKNTLPHLLLGIAKSPLLASVCSKPECAPDTSDGVALVAISGVRLIVVGPPSTTETTLKSSSTSSTQPLLLMGSQLSRALFGKAAVAGAKFGVAAVVVAVDSGFCGFSDAAQVCGGRYAETLRMPLQRLLRLLLARVICPPLSCEAIRRISRMYNFFCCLLTIK